MDITEVSVLPVDGDERLKAYVSIKLAGCFMVRDMKIIKGNAGYFVAMPAKRMKDGTYKDIFHPLDKPTRQVMEGKIMNEYLSMLRSRCEGSVSAPMPQSLYEATA
ncbi:MAG: septation protein SpoVG family protein [Deltaproteobacteria bacterium]|nr:septation protein SpoVG family protein [Deltaproteobacteria bacterium]